MSREMISTPDAPGSAPFGGTGEPYGKRTQGAPSATP